MAAEVTYVTGPLVEQGSGPLRGEAVLWVKVGQSDNLRPVRLMTADLVHLALQCLVILKRRF